MARKIMFGRYIQADSFIHRLDPRVKLAAAVFMMVVSLLSRQFWQIALVTLATGVIRPVLERTTIVHQPATVDIDKVNDLLRLLEGEKDFTALMDQGSPSKRYVRRIYEAKASQLDERIDFSIKGDGFLYHMVRIIVGTALMVGRGKLSLTEVEANLSAKKRVGLGPTMPPGGLCLERVYYEQALFGDDLSLIHI